MISSFDMQPIDPITGRHLERECWNSHHEGELGECISYSLCQCMCHDWRKLAPVDKVDAPTDNVAFDPYLGE